MTRKINTMKTFVTKCVSVTALGLLFDGAATAGPSRNLADSEWQEIKAAYEVSRHAFRSDAENRWWAYNPGQKWTTAFDESGFLIKPEDGGWEWGLSLKSYGIGPHQIAVGGEPMIMRHGSGLCYQWDGTLREWFLNDARGLEHGFVLERPPADRGAGALELVMEIRGGLRAEISADARGIDFLRGNGTTAIHYTGLKVWDADGKLLSARFEPGTGKVVRLLVDESQARYPITIDPVAQQAYLKASNTGHGDRFGNAIAIDGDTVVVGAPYESSNATGVNGDPSNNAAAWSGAVYVFVRSGGVWSQQAYLKASNTGSEDLFGASVAISGDTIAVGAWQEDSNATGVNGNQGDNSASSSGAVYVFTRNAGVWSQQAYLKASNGGAGDRFGISVDLDGETIAVGASHEDSNATGVGGDQSSNASADSGAVYVFTRSGITWSQQAYIKASDTSASDQLGGAVAISADTIVAGAVNESSNATGVNGNQANHISTPSAGAAYVFQRSGGTWTQQAFLKASNTGAYDQFGFSVAIDVDTIAVGATREASHATGVGGNQSNNLAADSGAVYVFSRGGGTWSQQAYIKASNTGDADNFGHSVAFHGNTLVVSARSESSNATGVNAPLTGGSGTQSDNSATWAGAAYVFTRNAGSWSQIAYLKASNAQAVDWFGHAVAVHGITILVGAPLEDSGSSGVNSTPDEAAGDSGAVYLFTLPVPAPVVSGISPSYGNVAGGAPVTINGINLSGATSVTIGGAAVTDMSIVDDTTITALTPAGALGAASVLVTTAGGTNVANSLFTYGLPGISLAQSGALSSNTSNSNMGNGGTVVMGWTADQQQPVTFTITNPGTADLTNIAIAKSGVDADDFTVSSLSTTSVPVGAGNAEFTVHFTPSSGGPKAATITIDSNVVGGNHPFTIHFQGLTLTTTTDTDGDGLNDATEFRLSALGFKVLEAQPALVETYFATAAGAGLFRPNQVRALRLPTPTFERDPVTGLYQLSFALETSASLDPPSFSPLPVSAPQVSVRDGKLEIRMAGQDDAFFFRLSAE